MGSKQKKKIASLIERIIFADLARAIAQERSMRKKWLRNFIVPQNIPLNYREFRKTIPWIYNVQHGLDLETAGFPLDEHLEKHFKKSCNANNAKINSAAAITLADFVRKQDAQAYPVQEVPLRLTPHRKVYFGLEHYIVRGEEAVFQYPDPRSTPLLENEARTMLHLIREAYCVGDFEDVQVEIVELSKVSSKSEERVQRVHSLSQYPTITWESVEDEIANVYQLLMELAEE